jgi:hypothetical protein
MTKFVWLGVILLNWLIQNREWLFSGIGVLAISVIAGLFIMNKSDEKINQSIKSGTDSNNIQGGKNVNVTIGGKKDE